MNHNPSPSPCPSMGRCVLLMGDDEVCTSCIIRRYIGTKDVLKHVFLAFVLKIKLDSLYIITPMIYRCLCMTRISVADGLSCTKEEARRSVVCTAGMPSSQLAHNHNGCTADLSVESTTNLTTSRERRNHSRLAFQAGSLHSLQQGKS